MTRSHEERAGGLSHKLEESAAYCVRKLDANDALHREVNKVKYALEETVVNRTRVIVSVMGLSNLPQYDI